MNNKRCTILWHLLQWKSSTQVERLISATRSSLDSDMPVSVVDINKAEKAVKTEEAPKAAVKVIDRRWHIWLLL